MPDKRCKVLRCQNAVRSNGLCTKHYFRVRTHGSTDRAKTKSEVLAEKGVARCPRCGQEKNLSEFNKDKHTYLGYSIYCRFCNRQKARERYLNHKERHKDVQLKSHFDITLEMYKEMESGQDGGCAICGRTRAENGKSLAVDHCHTSGKVRGLLCNTCNTGLGMFNDSASILRQAVEYLDRCSKPGTNAQSRSEEGCGDVAEADQED